MAKITEYKPIPGTTIKNALKNAKRLAHHHNTTVIANINDIMMCLNAKTDIDKALTNYHEKLDLKYEVMKIQRQNEF